MVSARPARRSLLPFRSGGGSTAGPPGFEVGAELAADDLDQQAGRGLEVGEHAVGAVGFGVAATGLQRPAEGDEPAGLRVDVVDPDADVMGDDG